MGRKIRRLRRPTASLRHPRTTKGSSIAAPFLSYKKRVRRAATAPNSPRTPGWVDFPDSPKAVASSAAGIISEILHKVPTCPRGVLALTVYASAATPLIVPSQGHLDRLKVSFAVWKFPASDHRACRLSIRRVNKEGSERGILIIGSHAAILRK